MSDRQRWQHCLSATDRQLTVREAGPLPVLTRTNNFGTTRRIIKVSDPYSSIDFITPRLITAILLQVMGPESFKPDREVFFCALLGIIH